MMKIYSEGGTNEMPDSVPSMNPESKPNLNPTIDEID